MAPHVDVISDVTCPRPPCAQGKSCFNFKAVEPALFKELAALARKGAERFRHEE
jgi:hypothetical protein